MAPKILVVDDDPAISEMLTIVLESEGLKPIPVMDGNDAVPAFEQHEPDLILLDLMLPGMNGVDICRAIRRESSVPIVMLTAKTDTVDVVLALNPARMITSPSHLNPRNSSPAFARACAAPIPRSLKSWRWRTSSLTCRSIPCAARMVPN